MVLRLCGVILLSAAMVVASPDAQARRHGHYFGRHPAFGLFPPGPRDQSADPSVWPRQPERPGHRGESRDGWARGRTVELDDLMRMCGELAEQLAVWPIAQIEQTVQPTDVQRAALAEVGTVSGEAAHRLRTACAAEAPATLTARLETVEKSLEAMLQATNNVRSHVETFYGLLDDERKARLVIWMNPATASDGTEQRGAASSRGRSAHLCEAPSSIQFVGLPVERLDYVLQPTPTQLAAVRALQSATAKALETLKLNCPREEALTPPKRVEIMWRRLDALLQAVKTISPAVRDLYELLSDEQKKRLDKTS